MKPQSFRNEGSRRIAQHIRRKERQQEAAARQEEYDNLSLEEKITRALQRGGTHTKEYKRLMALKNAG